MAASGVVVSGSRVTSRHTARAYRSGFRVGSAEYPYSTVAIASPSRRPCALPES